MIMSFDFLFTFWEMDHEWGEWSDDDEVALSIYLWLGRWIMSGGE